MYSAVSQELLAGIIVYRNSSLQIERNDPGVKKSQLTNDLSTHGNL